MGSPGLRPRWKELLLVADPERNCTTAVGSSTVTFTLKETFKLLGLRWDGKVWSCLRLLSEDDQGVLRAAAQPHSFTVRRAGVGDTPPPSPGTQMVAQSPPPQASIQRSPLPSPPLPTSRDYTSSAQLSNA